MGLRRKSPGASSPRCGSSGAGNPVATAPISGDRRILGLFRQWAEAYRYAGSVKGRRGGDACALHPPSEQDDSLLSARSLSAIRDIAWLVPELAPLCAPDFAETRET
jgi:hypothetical protein